MYSNVFNDLGGTNTTCSICNDFVKKKKYIYYFQLF